MGTWDTEISRAEKNDKIFMVSTNVSTLWYDGHPFKKH